MTILQELLEKKEVVLTDGSRGPLHSSISKEEDEFLQRLIASTRPENSLEVGLAFGVSALFICEAMVEVGGKRHIVIDPQQTHSEHWQGIGLRHLQEAGYGGMVKHYAVESQAALPQIVAEGAKIDFAFVDGNHTFDHTLADFFYIDKLPRVGGVVVFDDASFPSVHRGCRYVATNRSYRVCGQVGGRPRGSMLEWIARWPLARTVLANRFVQPDEAFGFHRDSSMVAFEKVGEDARRWDFDQEF